MYEMANGNNFSFLDIMRVYPQQYEYECKKTRKVYFFHYQRNCETNSHKKNACNAKRKIIFISINFKYHRRTLAKLIFIAHHNIPQNMKYTRAHYKTNTKIEL